MKTALYIFGLIGLIAVAVWLTKLAILQAQVSRYQAYWQSQREAPQAENAIQLIVLGDSSAQGIGASRPELSYVGRLAQSIAQQKGRPVYVTNLSVSGAKLQDVIEKQLPELQKLRMNNETVIVLSVGANDVIRGVSADFEAKADVLFGGLPKQTIVADVPYFGGGRYRSREAVAQQTNQKLLRAADRFQLQMAPLYEVTKDRDNLLVYAADYLHPSDRGYQNWHDAFWKVIDEQQ